MGHATESLEHAEHTAHAAGHHDDHANPMSMWVGITMAILGVLLAAAAAKVGGERTELVKNLVEQQHAHAKYQAQDIKHRTAVLSLRQLHATAEVGKIDGTDVLALASSVERYYKEAQAARAWVDAFDPAIRVHTDAQEEYELGQLAAEFGIVLASIALLLKRRAPWLLAVLLGCVAIGILGTTYAHAHHVLHETEGKIEETGKTYRELREAGKVDADDQALVDAVRAKFGATAAKP